MVDVMCHYYYFDHDADMGIVGLGNTVEDAFISAACAVFSIMSNIKEISATRSVIIEFEEEDLELALVTWLNQLLTLARIEDLIFGYFKLQRKDNYWRGEALGESWRPDLERGVEVKGATLTMLSVRKKERCWEARCVVDL